jgi:hypothetical protein
VTTATAYGPRATTEQTQDLQRLLARAEELGKNMSGTRRALNRAWTEGAYTVDLAADMIKIMLDEIDKIEQAVKSAVCGVVADGRYAVRTDTDDEHYAFYRVWNGDRATLVYLLAAAREQRMPRAARGVLAKIAEDPYEAACAYGREIGVCGMCNRTLTNPESIAAGIGPICASKF